MPGACKLVFFSFFVGVAKRSIKYMGANRSQNRKAPSGDETLKGGFNLLPTSRRSYLSLNTVLLVWLLRARRVEKSDCRKAQASSNDDRCNWTCYTILFSKRYFWWNHWPLRCRCVGGRGETEIIVLFVVQRERERERERATLFVVQDADDPSHHRSGVRFIRLPVPPLKVHIKLCAINPNALPCSRRIRSWSYSQ